MNAYDVHPLGTHRIHSSSLCILCIFLYYIVYILCILCITQQSCVVEVVLWAVLQRRQQCHFVSDPHWKRDRDRHRAHRQGNGN